MNIPPIENDDASGEAGAIGKHGDSKRVHFNPSDRLREADPLLGWFGLAAGVKESRHRKMKRGWHRGSVETVLLVTVNLATLIILVIGVLS